MSVSSPSMPKSEIRRRTILVSYPNWQWKLAFLVGVGALTGFFAGILALWLFPIVLDAFSQHRLAESTNVLAVVHRSWLLLFVCGSLLFLFFTTLGIYLGHRVAGPVYRFKKYILQRIAGDSMIPPVILRQDDYLQDLAQSLTNYFENDDIIKKSIIKLLDEFHEIDHTYPELVTTEAKIQLKNLSKLLQNQPMIKPITGGNE